MRRIRGPHIQTQGKPSGLKATLTWKQACSMDRMGFGRAVNACHYMPSRSSSDSSPHPQLGLGLGRAATRGEELARLAERGGLVYVCIRMRHDA